MFDQEAESGIIFDLTRAPTFFQRTTRPGISRKQADRYFDRLHAVEAARRVTYSDGQNMAEYLDSLIADGCSEITTRGRWSYLKNTETGETWLLRSQVERDYARTQLDLGPLARNY